MKFKMKTTRFSKNKSRLILLILFLLGNGLFEKALSLRDSLSLTATGPLWDWLIPGTKYICLADTPGYGTNIVPYSDYENLIPGIINITGTSGAKVRVNFILPEILLPGAGIGEIKTSYTNQSAALVDLGSGRPSLWFNPLYPLDIILDSSGRSQIWLVANLDVSPEVIEGDCFIRYGKVEVIYSDSMKIDSSSMINTDIQFYATISLAGDGLLAYSFSDLEASSLRPGINYICNTDTANNIFPLDSLNPETLIPGKLTIQWAPYAQVLITLSLPSVLRPKMGFGHVAIHYDSTFISVIDPSNNSILRHRWIQVPDSLIVTPNAEGRADISIVGNLNVSANVLEGDTLYGDGRVHVESTGNKRNSSTIFQQTSTEYFWKDIEFRAIIRKSKADILFYESDHIPRSITLYQNHPNPFNNSTKISFSIPVSDYVNITVFDPIGRHVKTLVNDFLSIGRYSVQFNGDDLPTGMYFYRLSVDKYTDTKKLVLLR